MLAAASSSSTWLRARRSRCVFLILCSPILIPFLFATFPLLCAAELFLRLCRLRSRGKLARNEAEDDRVRRCEEGRCAAEAEEREEMGLLQRYLEDQLLLVGSVYDCGEYDEDLYQGIQGYDDNDSNTPLLS
ncbi:PREDICTED: uncharacterized protein LOC101311100 [Fragaria vesca subsp. vesca]|uniref:uncharacterized protein LOC101311100 n=1 Tax=Fragaria vesca subsp. vesca TaxID=101020 RepID=UPI0002C30642|nr:PREDICTED: uncharacterized protein LOC101311100 [Fragaria vesca subsp. vesca]